MEVKIGVQNANRELVLDSAQSADDVEKAVTASLSGDDEGAGPLRQQGPQGHRPADKLAYVEIGTSTTGQVGYRS